MQPERRSAILTAILCASSLLGGCAMLDPASSQLSHQDVPAPDRNTSAALTVADILDQLKHLAEALPAQQAELVATAQREFELAPNSTHQLRYASMLALPGIGATDPKKAQSLLRELTAKPEALMPPERALATIELTQVDHQLKLDAERQRLQSSVERSDREHAVAVNKRLQAEVDENTRLKKQLDEAQAKLDAIANIERVLSERRTTPEARKP